jgi:cyclopropane-fatty-acyl-phospholipid synthase
MNHAARLAIDWTEQGLVPDRMIRAGIRRLLKQRIGEIDAEDAEAAGRRIERFVASMDEAPIALSPELANEQHYEVPAAFYGLALGPHRKYSACYWPEGVTTLGEAEATALAATCERAGLADGMHVLELGCGWGSLTLWMAEQFPRCRITAVSNSHSQRAHITREADRRGFRNVEVLTADMNRFQAPRTYDRVVSVEMFEHMRNWRRTFAGVHSWLKPGGRFFMHVFAHRAVPYAFEARDDSDWMSRLFFSGGMMPSDELAARFQDHMRLVRRWRWDGTHYQRTAEAWLANLDSRRDDVLAVLAETHGAEDAGVWLQRWRIFFMACAELFGFRQGQEWWVSHYLFERPEVT